MSNIALGWDPANARGDWSVRNGGIDTGHVLRTAVLISLFTDRRAPEATPNGADLVGSIVAPQLGQTSGLQPQTPGVSADPRGWWQDSFDSVPIGSRLWTLRRRKVANRPRLVAEATDLCREALQWLIDDGLAIAVAIQVSALSLRPGVLLDFTVTLRQPDGAAPVVRALWRAETSGETTSFPGDGA